MESSRASSPVPAARSEECENDSFVKHKIKITIQCVDEFNSETDQVEFKVLTIQIE